MRSGLPDDIRYDAPHVRIGEGVRIVSTRNRHFATTDVPRGRGEGVVTDSAYTWHFCQDLQWQGESQAGDPPSANDTVFQAMVLGLMLAGV